jgi:hypothetical protein
MEKDFSLIDLREQYFKVSNRIFTQELDVYEIGVYTYLCRLANNSTTESYPSHQKIADSLKISKRKVISTLHNLVFKGIIYKKTGGGHLANKYYLTSISSARESLVHTIHPSSAHDAPLPVHSMHPKKTHDINTNKKDSCPLFNQFWDLYDYKIGKPKCLSKWKKLSAHDKDSVLKALPKYICSTPDKAYRKHPATYLNQRAWEDEIITRTAPTAQQNGLSQKHYDWYMRILDTACTLKTKEEKHKIIEYLHKNNIDAKMFASKPVAYINQMEV